MEIPYISASNLKTPAEILKSARLEKGFSIRELAQRVDCSHVHLLKIERGEKRPAARLLDKLQRELAIPSFQIIHKSNGPKGTLEKPTVGPTDAEIIRLPPGAGGVVALLIETLMRGGYKPVLLKPAISKTKYSHIVTIEIDLGSDGKMTIPLQMKT
jgi:transcriptional regulator with XRE-family HTH domain